MPNFDGVWTPNSDEINRSAVELFCNAWGRPSSDTFQSGKKCHLGKICDCCTFHCMAETRDPHEIDLAELFPSLPPERREARRDFLDRYCEIAYRVFERLERQRQEGVDPLE